MEAENAPTPLNRHQRFRQAKESIEALCCSRLTVRQLMVFMALCIEVDHSRFGPDAVDIEKIETLARHLSNEY